MSYEPDTLESPTTGSRADVSSSKHASNTSLSSPAEHLEVGLEITDRCCQACDYCGKNCSPQTGKRDKMELADFKKVMTTLMAEFGCKKVKILGGEPALCKFYVELIEWCSANGLETELITNGVAVGEEDLVRFSKLANFRIAVSIQGGSEEAADAIAHLPGSHKATLTTIKRAIGLGMIPLVTMITFEKNTHTQSEARESLLKVGLPEKDILFIPPRALGRARRLAAHDKTVQSAYSENCRTCTKGALTINASGDVYACFVSSTSLGSIFEKGIAEICRSEGFSQELARIRFKARNDPLV